MARYTGPVCRICRRYGEKLMLKGDKCVTKCTLDKRPQPPGAPQTRRRKLSDRALQLREKQKARYTYGVLEKQFVDYYKEAVRQPGVTGENLVRLLEMRLDNVVYKLGFADSLKAGATGRAARPHHAERPQDGHPVRRDEGRRRRSAGCASSKKTEYFKIAQGEHVEQAGARVAERGRGADDRPRRLGAGDRARRRRSSTRR